MEETRIRSLSKGIFYRFISIITLIIITYIFTGNLIQVTLITVITTVTFILVFFIHERIWLRVKRPEGRLKRSIAKMFTYITLLGIAIMSGITYLVTGNIQITTNVTVTYVVIKHFLYVINELVWYKIKWGSKEGPCLN
jgi:uncharacterized membrane protein